ncbi:MAG: hypothetical protein LLG01_00305 [Planctomycetaceae bacterium]|nr:hypothetical protein [Planctomycetaceae bacterium]
MKVVHAGFIIALAAAAGCDEQLSAPPASSGEYALRSQDPRTSYPRFVIVQYNLQRALDNSLATDKRIDSLKLADTLGGGEPQVREAIGELLGDAKAPDALREGALTFLLRRDAPGLGETLMKHWPVLATNDRLREAAMGYLERNPNTQVFEGILKVWAEVPGISGVDENRYRRVVESTSKKPWVQALLDSINTPGFRAKGSAIKLLTRRVNVTELRTRIEQVPAQDPAMAALQIFLDRFNYIPSGGPEFMAIVQASQMQRKRLPDTEKLFQFWQRSEMYAFNIRDLHLLTRLGSDPLRNTSMGRLELIAALGKNLMTRKHVTGGVISGSSGFAMVSDRLSIADAWNLYLLDEMLSRPGMQRAMGALAIGDRTDKRSQWGGLVMYDSGMATAKIYEPDRMSGESDQLYVPTQRMLDDSTDCLCRFVCHFDQAQNIKRAGVTAAELAAARDGNYCGLIVTSVSAGTFAAHYYNPRGVVVSLGIFPLK